MLGVSLTHPVLAFFFFFFFFFFLSGELSYTSSAVFVFVLFFFLFLSGEFLLHIPCRFNF